ncbi:lytic transglycosylase domain-containing protein [Sphingosinicella sp. CPCC 101087]|uniref:lytic transglycosylase domain-containing protein n=1 Tax=Sphingosinicella sp. CPCC 101087 TaxID=2497754 RepID=UPI00101D54F4|nr:lytic transglycosylase domain-containing protein [Sphingosinicella sp. CPCC 101087]
MAGLRAGLLAGALLWAAPVEAASLARWSPFIAEASARFGIPEEWIRRVIRAESGGRTMLRGRPIVSRAGAMGLMQLMPGTWREMRGLLGLGADPHHPRDNIVAGTAYLRMMYDRFGYPGLFAAYNAGPARYAQYLATGRRLPRETIAYLDALAGTGSAMPVTKRKPAPAGALFAVRASSHAGGAGLEPLAPADPSAALFVVLRRSDDD